VEAERRRLLAAWGPPEDAAPEPSSPVGAVLPEGVELDRFEAVQLAEVVRVCRASATLSMAGRRLFAVSRARRSSVNDADRLRKYLARFQLDWDSVRDPAALEAALRRSLSADPSAS
jgi:transcriptional regulatory protein RtcR